MPGWLLAIMFAVSSAPLAFWWCCCRTGRCQITCCRSGTAPNSGGLGVEGFEFKFTSIGTRGYPFTACPAGSCDTFYDNVSIILDYGVNGECMWRGLGLSMADHFSLDCVELPEIRVYFSGCSTDRKQIYFTVAAITYPHIRPETTRLALSSSSAGDIPCNALMSGTLSALDPYPTTCIYAGAQFTLQAIPA